MTDSMTDAELSLQHLLGEAQTKAEMWRDNFYKVHIAVANHLDQFCTDADQGVVQATVEAIERAGAALGDRRPSGEPAPQEGE